MIETKSYKYLLYSGIILLTLGILGRVFSPYKTYSLLLIITGVMGKASYIYIKYKQGFYKPGKELLLLIVGLCLFFLGLYLRNIENALHILFMTMGIVLKAAFVILFIKKSKTR